MGHADFLMLGEAQGDLNSPQISIIPLAGPSRLERPSQQAKDRPTLHALNYFGYINAMCASFCQSSYPNSDPCIRSNPSDQPDLLAAIATYLKTQRDDVNQRDQYP